jgi:hypothetical protein
MQRIASDEQRSQPERICRRMAFPSVPADLPGREQRYRELTSGGKRTPLFVPKQRP